MIKKLQFIIPLFVLAIMLGGCPYSSKVAIDAPSIKVTDALLGSWEPKDGDDKITVSKKDANTYAITKKSSSGNETKYEAFMSKIGEDQFLNIYETADEAKTYYFYKVILGKENTKLTLVPVTENIDEEFKSSAELKAFFEKYKSLSFFFGKEENVYYRQ